MGNMVRPNRSFVVNHALERPMEPTMLQELALWLRSAQYCIRKVRRLYENYVQTARFFHIDKQPLTA